MPDDALVGDYEEWAPVGGFNPEDVPPPPEPEDGPEPVVEGVVPLGYDRDVFYYFSRAARQVFALTAAQHGRNTLAAMASVAHYWQRTQFLTDKGAIKWDEAIDHLMSSCRETGIFDPDRLRGRGAWIDDGRAVLHTGDRLIVNGQPAPLMLPGSRYIYEAAKPLTRMVAPPLAVREAHKLFSLCGRLRWEAGVSGTLLAGFLAVAPVCGGLAWRPSIWITGGSGSGKTWINENLIAPALAGIALRVISKTSEAGIRQRLGSDARPVVFDEAEREDAASAARMQGVLDLVRQSSSESGAEIVKGSQNQTGAKSYRVRSCFAFVSINVAIMHQADESRITVLSLRNPPSVPDPAEADRFRLLVADTLETITPAFTAGLLARSTMLLPVIRANAETFAQAVALHVGSRRLGDQIGTLLAGAYSLHSDRAITPEEAEAYVKRQQWDARPSGEVERDECRLLTTLMQHRVRCSPGNSAPMEVTVGRLISAAWGGDDRIARDVAEDELRSSGFRTDADQGIFVSTNHPAIRRALSGTQWEARWSAALCRLPGAEMCAKAVRFGPLHISKATWISRKTLEGDE